MKNDNGDCYVIFFCIIVLGLGLAVGVLLHLAKQEEAKVAEITETTQVPETESEISETTEKTRSIDPETTPEPSYGKDARPAIEPTNPRPPQPEPRYDWRAPEPAPPRIIG